MRRVALTTEDNPFDPFDEFDRWFHFDSESGYHTSGKIARVASVSDDLSDADNTRSIEDAIDLIIEVHPTSNYRKLVRAD